MPYIFAIVLVALLGCQSLQGQLPDVNWFFGASNAGMTFDTSQNSVLANNVKSEVFGQEGCVTVSDPTSGELLFYTDGNYLYDNKNRLIASDLGGNTSTAQAVSVCRFPCNPNKYFLFSSNAYLEAATIFPGTLQYAIVEVVKDSIVITESNRNIVLADDISEVKTIISNPNENSYWLVGFKNQSSLAYVYKVDCNGVSEVQFYDFQGEGYEAIFYPTVLKYSAVNNQLVLTSIGAGLSILDFDPRSGIISNYNKVIAYNDPRAYDAEWSSDGSKLYVSKFAFATLVQYDLSSGRITPLYFSLARGGGLQTGADGFIYHIPDGAAGQFLNRIERPNEFGLNCRYVEDAYDVGLPYTAFKLPEPVVSKEGEDCLLFYKEFGDEVVCSGQETSVLIEIVNNSCDTFDRVFFSDDLEPFGLVVRTAEIQNGNIVNGTGEGQSKLSIEDLMIYPGTTNLEFDVVFNLSESDTIYNQAYLQIPFFEDDTFYSDDPLTDGLFDATEIIVNNDLTYDFFKSDTALCDEEVLILSVGGFFETIEWSDGSSDTSLTVQEEDLYYVITTDDCGIYTDSIEVTYRNCECDYFVPNAFSPNGDNVNDKHEVHISNGTDYHLMVFNRWGEMVFETYDLAQGWNGTFKGQLLSTDVFGYLMQFTCDKDGQRVQKRVTLPLFDDFFGIREIAKGIECF